MPTLAGDRGGGQPVVAGDHVDADAGPVQPGDRGGNLRPQRVEHGCHPGQAQVLLGVLALGGDRGPGGQHPAGNGQHPQAALRVAGHDARGLVAVGGGDRHVAVAAADPGDPGQDLLGRALGVHHQAPVLVIDRGHELEPGVEAEQLAAARLPAGQRDVGAAAGGQLEQRELGGVAARLAAGAVQVGVVAGGRALGEQAGARRPAAVGRGGQVRRPAWLASPSGVHTVVTRIRFSVRVPVLSVQMTEVDPRVSTARQPLDEGAAAGHLADADGEREGDRGQQSFRDVGDQQPDREAGRGGHAQPGGQADRQERDPGPDRDERDQHGGPLDLVFQRAVAAPGPLAESGDPAQLGAHPGGGHQGLGLAAGAGGAAEHHVGCLQQRHAGVGRAGGAGHRHRLAGERGHVHLKGAGHQAGVRADAFAFLDQQDIAGHQQPRLDFLAGAVAQHPGMLGQERRQRLHRPFGLHLLREREAGVQQDHRGDRDRQPRCPAGPGQHRGHREQDRQRLGELRGKLARPAPAPAPGQLVRPGHLQPPRRLTARQAARRGPQVPEQLGQRLKRVGRPVRNAGTRGGAPPAAGGARSSRPVPVLGGFRSRHGSSIWPVHVGAPCRLVCRVAFDAGRSCSAAPARPSSLPGTVITGFHTGRSRPNPANSALLVHACGSRPTRDLSPHSR